MEGIRDIISDVEQFVYGLPHPLFKICLCHWQQKDIADEALQRPSTHIKGSILLQ